MHFMCLKYFFKNILKGFVKRFSILDVLQKLMWKYVYSNGWIV